ncbi:MAG: C45 family autoproteolytic acyltransferase/hydrolase [Candidatus Helarchaeota archaeon]
MNKKYAAILILILFIFGFGLAYFWLDKFEVPTKVITIQGSTHYELGVSYGMQCREQIRAFQGIIGIADIILGVAGFTSSAQFIAEIEPYIPPYLLDEMNGVARGAGVPNSTIILINAFADILNYAADNIMACTQFIFANKTNTAAGPIYGRNLDYFPNHILDNFQVVLRIFPPSGKAVIGHTIAGMVGLLGGMNSDGVCVSVSLVDTKEVGLGIPAVLAIRDALNYADNASIGTAILNGSYSISDGRTHSYQNQTSGWNYGVLDLDGTAAMVETTNQNSYTRWEGDTANGEYVGWLAAANHFTSSAMISKYDGIPNVGNTYNRWNTMNQLMAQANATQQFEPYEAMQTLRNQWDPVLNFNLGGDRSIDNLDLYTKFIPSGSMASFIMCPLLNYTLVTLCQPSFGDFYVVSFDNSNPVVGPIY